MCFFFQAEDGIRDLVRSRGLGDVYKRQEYKLETFGRDLREMLQDKLTFDEAIAKPELLIMVRQRLKIIKDDLFKQLEGVSQVLA